MYRLLYCFSFLLFESFTRGGPKRYCPGKYVGWDGGALSLDRYFGRAAPTTFFSTYRVFRTTVTNTAVAPFSSCTLVSISRVHMYSSLMLYLLVRVFFFFFFALPFCAECWDGVPPRVCDAFLPVWWILSRVCIHMIVGWFWHLSGAKGAGG